MFMPNRTLNEVGLSHNLHLQTKMFFNHPSKKCPSKAINSTGKQFSELYSVKNGLIRKEKVYNFTLLDTTISDE